MPPSLLSVNLIKSSLYPDWPAFYTRIPSPWPSPQGEGTDLWMPHSAPVSTGKGEPIHGGWQYARNIRRLREFANITTSHIFKPEIFQTLNPERGEMAPSAPFSPCGRRVGDEGKPILRPRFRPIPPSQVELHQSAAPDGRSGAAAPAGD